VPLFIVICLLRIEVNAKKPTAAKPKTDGFRLAVTNLYIFEHTVSIPFVGENVK